MGNIKYLILSIFLIACIAGCKKGQKADYDDNFHPRIIDNNRVFESQNRIIYEGQSAVYTGLAFSPTPQGKTKISWKVNGKEVSTDTTYTFTPTGGGQFEIKVEATYNGQTSTRISNVLVSPTNYTPKSYTNIAMAYLTDAATFANIDLPSVTHITFAGARVPPTGVIDFTQASTNQNLDEIVARSHIGGVPVLLGIKGTLSPIDNWSIWENKDFSTALLDPVKRASMAEVVIKYVTDHRLDGVDVMMTDFGHPEDIVINNLTATGQFVTLLRAGLPTKIITITATTNYLRSYYGAAVLAKLDWVNVHAYEDATVGPGSPVAQPSSYDYMVSCATNWAALIPKDKIVLGIPAFGLRFNQLDENGNNQGWGSYDYMRYREILAEYPDAYNHDNAPIKFGVFYNGKPLVDRKTAYIKTNGFKGAYLYAGDYDVKGPNSLMATIYQTLK